MSTPVARTWLKTLALSPTLWQTDISVPFTVLLVQETLRLLVAMTPRSRPYAIGGEPGRDAARVL